MHFGELMKKHLLAISLTTLSATALVGCFEVPKLAALSTPYSPLNDTGITACGDYAKGNTEIHNNDVDCGVAGSTQTNDGTSAGDPVPAGQDAVYGRDVTHADNSDGHAGFSFTKLDVNGDALADQTQDYATNPWSCVKDNVTGLIWEVKTDDGGLHDKYHTYTWYNSTGLNDGGDHGVGDTGVGTTTGFENSATVYAGSDHCTNNRRCDTEKFVADVNAAALCGFNDWRVPVIDELNNIVARNRVNPAIDTSYFPHATSSSYWSASPYATISDYAWAIYFNDGFDYTDGKSYSTNTVRLVRASQ